MSKPSLDLLHSLEAKLKAANIRSPYLRATIGRSRNRIDLQQLDLLSSFDSRSKEFIAQLTNGEQSGEVAITLRIDADNVTDKNEEERVQMDTLMKRLKNIHFDQEEDFLEHGTRSFGFGYPMLAITSKKDKNRVILAPLFIWSLDIYPLPNNHHAYSINRSAEHPIYRNPQLATFLSNEYGLSLDKIPEDFFDDGCLTLKEIDNLTEEICKLTGAKIVAPEEHAAKIQALDYYGKMLDNAPLIFKSGIFTLFKSNKESIIADYDQMINGLDDMLFDSPELYHPYQEDYFASTPLDPSQEGILRNISEHKKVIIQGPPGTGKSNSLTGIILNALENGATTLVVCEKKTALEVIEENLQEKGLDELCAVIDNITSDRQKIVRALRERFDNRDYLNPSQHSLNEYRNVKKEYHRFYELMQSKYGNLLTKIVGDLSWKDCIGNFLEAKRKTAHQEGLILKNIEPSFFTQTHFYTTLQKLKDASFLFEATRENYALFDHLSDELFQEKPSTRLLQSQLESFSTIGNDEFEKWNRYSNDELLKYAQPSFGLKVKSWFNKETKEHISQVQQLESAFKKATHPLRKLMVPEAITSQNSVELKEIYLTYYKRLQAILEVKNEYRDYYKWRHFKTTELDTVQNQIIETLLNDPTEDWEPLFRKWFFNEVLMLKELDLGDFPTSDRELNTIIGFDDEIDAQQSESITQYWHARQKNTTEGRTLKSLRLLFNLRMNQTYGRRNSLRKLMHEEFDLISAFFPVILVNPSVCSSVFPLQQGLFDVVIFDEASQLRVEDTFPALLRGRFQIISGDVHQMPPSTHFRGESIGPQGDLDELDEDVVFAEEESLLTYAQNADFEFNYLDFHYRSQHPYLIDFSNAAFYGKRLVPMPPTYHGKPLELVEVNSSYDESRNEGEANAILDFLFNQLTPNERGEYPSVGIATFNMTQQRFIWEKIWELADQQETVRTKLAALEEAGLFVKNLENIQGDQRDIVLISTTFGVRTDGRFIQNFGPINRDKGYKLLNVIVTRAKQRVIVFTSIPSEYYNSYRSEIITKGNTGKGIFYAYLTYVKLCTENNEPGRQALLNFLLENSGEQTKEKETQSNPDHLMTESVFEEEVLEELLKFTRTNHIKTQFELGGFRLDIAVKDKTDAPIVIIECDGKAYHSSKVAYRYDIHRQKILERHGLTIYRIWSTNWWRDRDREALKLKRFLQEHVPDALKEK